jgi:hypothetical protein
MVLLVEVHTLDELILDDIAILMIIDYFIDFLKMDLITEVIDPLFPFVVFL